jgi:poly(hydroxyalkanoate) granule-associated protein
MASRKPARLPRSLRKGDLPRAPVDVWLAGLGALTDAAGRGRGRFDALVAEGRRVQAEGGRAVRDALDVVAQLGAAAGEVAEPVLGVGADGLEHAVERVLGAAGLPRRDDLDGLHARLHELHARVAGLSGEPAERATVAVEVHADGWSVRVDGRGGPVSVHATKKGALGDGRRLARSLAPSRLLVHRADGSAGESLVYGA